MKRSIILSLAILTSTASIAVSEVTGSWAIDKQQCSYPRDQRYEFTIRGNKITNLEFDCSVKSRSKKNGYIIVKAVCCGEGMCDPETIRYKVDKSGSLIIKVGEQTEEKYSVRCR
jgi:hypothetical protein